MMQCKKASLGWPVELAVVVGLVLQIWLVAGAVLAGITASR